MELGFATQLQLIFVSVFILITISSWKDICGYVLYPLFIVYLTWLHFVLKCILLLVSVTSVGKGKLCHTRMYKCILVCTVLGKLDWKP